jgi:hypothetical protein
MPWTTRYAEVVLESANLEVIILPSLVYRSVATNTLPRWMFRLQEASELVAQLNPLSLLTKTFLEVKV